MVSVKLSKETHELLSQLREDGEKDDQVVERVLAEMDAVKLLLDMAQQVQDLSFSVHSFRRLKLCIQKMRGAGHSADRASCLCKALYCDQSDAVLQEAFQTYDLNDDKTIDQAELRKAISLSCEDLPEDKLNALFNLVDTNKSGRLELDEFKVILKGMKSDAGTSWPDLFSGIDLSMFSLEDTPLVDQLKDAGFPKEKAIALSDAHQGNQTDEALRNAFHIVSDGKESIGEAAFRAALPLLGKNLSSQEIEELMTSVGKADGEQLSCEGFCAILRALKKRDSTSSDYFGEMFAGWSADVQAPIEPSKAEPVVNLSTKLKENGYNDSQASALNKSWTGPQGDHQLKKQFAVLADGGEAIHVQTLKGALPVLDAKFTGPEIEELFKDISSDKLDAEAFSTIIKNAKARQAELEAADGPSIGGYLQGMTFGFWNDDKAEVAKQKMLNSGMSEERASTLCRAIFGEHNDGALMQAFRAFDKDGSNTIDKNELQKALPLLGEEEVAGDKLAELFRAVDKNGTGKMEYIEFCMLVRGIRNKDQSSTTLTEAVSAAAKNWF